MSGWHEGGVEGTRHKDSPRNYTNKLGSNCRKRVLFIYIYFKNIFIYLFIVLILRVWGLGTVSPRIFPILLIPIGFTKGLNNK